MKSEPRVCQTLPVASPATNDPSTHRHVVITGTWPLTAEIVEPSRRDVLNEHEVTAQARRLRDEAAGRCGR